jgi:sugar phosphate isomerase/epimerase
LLVPARGESLGPLGLEIYSLRRELAKDIPGTLALVKQWGFGEVEVPGFYGLNATAFHGQLDRAQLKCTAMVAQYDRLSKDLKSVVADARVLGATYVIYPWIPHQDNEFILVDCERAAVDMNRWGRTLRQEGLELYYHPHGYEFRPSPEGTLFDLLAARTDPTIVNFQADVFWIAWAGQDPVKLLRRYPTRFLLMHLKDLRKGSKVGDSSGHAPEEASVALGTGMLDFPAIVREAKRIGVRRYYIEDEAPEAESNIPVSLKYSRSLGF